MSNQIALDLTLDALGDPMRRRILERLSGQRVAVGDLAEGLPIGRPAVSRHLRVLTEAGLVEHTPRGTRNLYALAPDGQRELQQWLVSLWDTALISFGDSVPNSPVATSPVANSPVASSPVPAQPVATKPEKQKAKKSSARQKKSNSTAHKKHTGKRAKKKSRSKRGN